MAAFRLKMATQLGEKIAANAGFTSFPIKPREIAESKGIVVHAKPADVKGVSGGLIFVNNDVSLFFSTEYNNEGFENFSIAHELGHYFLPDHPAEILKAGGVHLSRADFTQNSSIELEADHFASGMLLPSKLTADFLLENQIGLEGIIQLADVACCSRTAAAIRSAQCCHYPVAVIVSEGAKVAYAFLSDRFKTLGQLAFLRKGTPLPDTETRRFNSDPSNVSRAKRACATTDLGTWFGGSHKIGLDEEIVGLGAYGFTLTVLTSEDLPADPQEDEDEEAELEKSYTPRFAYGR